MRSFLSALYHSWDLSILTVKTVGIDELMLIHVAGTVV